MGMYGWGRVCTLVLGIVLQTFASSDPPGCASDLVDSTDYSPRTKTILAVPDGNALAHTTRTVQVASELRKLGYRVQFATDGKYVPLIRAAGFACEPHLTLDPKSVLNICREGRTNYYTEEFLHRCVEADCALFDRVKPDLVLSDFRFSVSTSAEVAKVPHAVILNSLWTNYFSGRLTAPENTVFSRIFGKTLVSLLSPYLTKLVKSWVLKFDNRAHNRVRRAYGLKKRTDLLDLIAGDLNLLADIPAFGPTKNLPERFVYVGPIVWQPEIAEPDWFGKLDPERPAIYISMGSTGDPRMFEEVVRVFGDTPYQCMITTAGLAKMESLPSNIHVVEFAPGEKLMAKADLVICQGGNGTVYQALRSGVPILGYPTMHDQHFNMDQVERLGMGTRMSLYPFDADTLRAEADRIVSGRTQYRSVAESLKPEFEKYPGEKAAALAIDRHLRNLDAQKLSQTP